MPVRTTAAFVAGFAAGWVSRSALGPTREALVQAVALAHGAKERVRRTIAEQREWVEDLVAEGRARFEESRAGTRGDAVLENDTPPVVVDVRKRRGRAA